MKTHRRLTAPSPSEARPPRRAPATRPAARTEAKASGSRPIEARRVELASLPQRLQQLVARLLGAPDAYSLKWSGGSGFVVIDQSPGPGAANPAQAILAGGTVTGPDPVLSLQPGQTIDGYFFNDPKADAAAWNVYWSTVAQNNTPGEHAVGPDAWEKNLKCLSVLKMFPPAWFISEHHDALSGGWPELGHNSKLQSYECVLTGLLHIARFANPNDLAAFTTAWEYGVTRQMQAGYWDPQGEGTQHLARILNPLDLPGFSREDLSRQILKVLPMATDFLGRLAGETARP